MPPEVKVRLSVEGTPEALAAFRSVQAGAQKAGKGAATGLAPLSGALMSIKGLLASVGIAVGVVAAAKALSSFAVASVRAAREAGDTAKELGTTVEAYSSLAVVAARAGKSPDKLNTGLGILAQRIDALRAGEPGVTAAFRRIGLAKESFPGDDIAQNADIVARALMRFEASGTRSALATAVLGRQGRELITIFEKLIQMGGLEGAIGYARRTGKLIDESIVVTLEALAESTRRLKMEAGSASLQFMKGFGPEMVATLETLAETLDGTTTPAFERAGEALGRYIRKAVVWSQVVAESSKITVDRAVSTGAGLARLVLASVAPTKIGEITAQVTVDNLMLANRKANSERWMAFLGDQYTDETEKKLAQIRTEELADVKKYRTGLLMLDAYMKARNARIERETGLQIAALQHQIEVLAWGEPDARARQVIARATTAIALLEKEKPARLAEAAPERFTTPGAPDARAAAEREAKAGEALLKARQAELDLLEAQAKVNYEAAKTSLEDYYADRLRIIFLRETAELDLLTAKWAEARKIKDAKGREDALRTISAQTDEVTARGDTERTQAAEQYGDLRVKLEKALAAVSAQRMEDEGRQHELRLRRIREQMEAYQLLLVQAGMSPENAAIKAAANAGVDTQRENFRERLEQTKADLEKLSALGATPEDIQRLKDLAAALREVATALGPDAVKSVGELDQSIAHLRTPTSFLQDEAAALQSGFTSFFGSTITGFRSATEAARGFLLMLAQITMQVLASRWATTLFGGPAGKAAGGRIEKRAGGGRIYGGGTWTSDSVPILASRDEQMIRAAIASMSGVRPYLELLNAGEPAAVQHAQAFAARQHLATRGRVVRLREWGTGEQLQRLAAGGQVRGASGAGGGEFTGALTLNLPPGVTLGPDSNAIYRDRAGREWVLGIVINNRRTLRQFGA